MAIDLKGRVCVVTGAGRGIGSAVAEGFARRGAVVIPSDIQAPTFTGTQPGLAWDVTDPGRAEQVMDEVESRHGRIDALVANAGVYPRQKWDATSPEQWREQLSINLDGAWHAAQSAAKRMARRGYGKIVLVTSVQVVQPPADDIPYVAAKAGLLGLTRALARAVGPRGVRVNAVMPGAVRTQTELKLYPDQEQVARACDAMQCLPGRIEPAMIEPVFAFLCCAESDIITGQVVCADQGMVHY